jgi:hypothetical protein
MIIALHKFVHKLGVPDVAVCLCPHVYICNAGEYIGECLTDYQIIKLLEYELQYLNKSPPCFSKSAPVPETESVTFTIPEFSFSALAITNNISHTFLKLFYTNFRI